MVEDKSEPREIHWRQLFPWTELFQGFRIALDLNKLLLAAAGIVVMALGWWVLANIFYYQKPVYKDYTAANEKGENESEKNNKAWAHFKTDLGQWTLMHRAAGPGPTQVQVEDVADSLEEYDRLRNPQILAEGSLTVEERAKLAPVGSMMRGGSLRTLPWDEDRGPNPFLLATGKAGVPWEAGHFWHWLTTEEMPVLIEPIYKLFKPVGYFIDPRSGSLGKLYFLLVLLWTAATWALFGGAITRIAAVQIARQEKIGLKEALRYTTQKYVHYLAAPVFPLIFVGILLIIMIVFGLFGMIPILGEIVYALFWPIIVLLGLGMAIALIGLVGWPMMSATISTEGTDSWEAVSRSYSYVFQAPWNFAWYCMVALFYGAIVVFFVGFVGSFSVDLAKWGVRQTPFIQTANRDPGFLFVYAPKSFGWRQLLLRETQNSAGTSLVASNGQINEPAYELFVSGPKEGPRNPSDMSPWNKFGAFLVSGIWLNLIFLLIIGFGYSFFWSSSTIIYMLMRRKVDDADLDEVYMEDDEQIEPPSFTPSKPPSAPAPSSSTMVEPPSLRTPASPPAPPTPIGVGSPEPGSSTGTSTAPPTPAGTDGNPSSSNPPGSP